MSKEQANEILEGNNIIKVIEESIKNSMIPDDPIEILEQLWDNF